jgi:oligopeptide/dipeptide ABC transporter ATP-binding protein
MRQRVVIALALCAEPELVIADEPTTALDVSVQAQILDLMKSLCRERNVGMILITHDMGVISETADRVAVMYRGRVVETGTTKQIMSRPRHDYTKALISAVPRPDKRLKRFPLVTYIEDAVSGPRVSTCRPTGSARRAATRCWRATWSRWKTPTCGLSPGTRCFRPNAHLSRCREAGVV